VWRIVVAIFIATVAQLVGLDRKYLLEHDLLPIVVLLALGRLELVLLCSLSDPLVCPEGNVKHGKIREDF
jgi:hypothetical protein